MSNTKRLNIEKLYFDYIEEGIKKVEGRRGTENHYNLKVGDTLIFVSPDGKTMSKIIKKIRIYNTFEDYVMSEWNNMILPQLFGISDEIIIEKSWEIYGKFPGWDLDDINNKYGMIAFEI